jgi:hypothetical protein
MDVWIGIRAYKIKCPLLTGLSISWTCGPDLQREINLFWCNSRKNQALNPSLGDTAQAEVPINAALTPYRPINSYPGEMQ